MPRCSVIPRRLLGPALAAALALAPAGCVRAPAPLDVTALIRAHGEAGARGELAVRILDAPRDIRARLALAQLADAAHRPTDALAQLEAVLDLGGPLGPRWHRDDQARYARLLVARGRARLARNSVAALADLERAQKFGAPVSSEETARATAVLAIAHVRHIDPVLRGDALRTLASLAGARFADPSWKGAALATTPHTRGELGVWLWKIGARRAAWETLRAWRTTTAERDLAENSLHAAYLRAYAWWTPLDGAEPPASDLVGPGRCYFASAQCTPPSDPFRAPSTGSDGKARDAGGGNRLVAPEANGGSPDPSPRAAALENFVHARRPDVAIDATSLLAAYRRDPTIADRLANDAIAHAIDPAPVHASLGMVFDALGDPARARRQWQAAVDASADASYVRGLAVAIARAGDPDAGLVIATSAAAAHGDPAVVWIEVSRAMEEVGSHAQALEAARNAMDLAGRDTYAAALTAALAPSRALGRTAQADALERRRAQLVAAPGDDPGDTVATAYPTAVMAAHLWVTSRTRPRDVASRRALLAALDRDDPRYAVIVAELVALAGDHDPIVGRAALAAIL